ncbi:MAG: hypothetical protein HPY45_00120 [Anaerolineae bacterium]|nr:hypothetical protein [Anaerolineae bacterium]
MIPGTPDTFTLVNTLRNITRHWQQVALFMLAGALLGWLTHLFLPPIYESSAEITVSIDFTRTGLLTDIEEDQIMVTAGDVINSSVTVNKLLAQAAAERIDISPETFRKNSYLERQNQKWLLRIQSHEPLEARRLAELWAQAAFETLTEAYSHALKADRLLRYSDSLVSCMEQAVWVDPAAARCDYTRLQDLQTELQQVSLQAEAEKQSAMGLSSALTFSLTRLPESSQSPVRNKQGEFTFAGAILGLCLALGVIHLDLKAWLPQRAYRGK